MKTLLFAFVMSCGIMFASCGNSTAKSEVVDTTAVDTAAVDSLF